MKTKVFFFVIALISTVVIFSSCESKSGKRLREKEKAEKVSELKADTMLFSPEKIGVSKLLKEYIPYPKYDGGTGMRMSFSIGIKYKGKTYQVDVKDSKFFGENITEKEAEKSMSDLILTHYLSSNTPENCIDVLVVKGEVVKLTRRADFILDDFYPAEIIWQKK